ncbi:hypothetical protein M431DRAFT_505726 [Trichoderma harzianum CBS 226.95]|jgi:hypothetical protein|uniref:Secreted protein n=1 Tax=Trichoderma harzianum CBS 226.95 TaxID=983964 RepID=A0A2T4AM71_TRIHA|nr:hypothetical protein M431DRAFT_505726 [Trichoderma harzianum CBS 226.95]PTB58175.1 hypothetical protein M431DRAFT_505726 [Trichoderma harzianum CBS 226.95]
MQHGPPVVLSILLVIAVRLRDPRSGAPGFSYRRTYHLHGGYTDATLALFGNSSAGYLSHRRSGRINRGWLCHLWLRDGTHISQR